MTQALYAQFTETDAPDTVQRKSGDNSLLYVALALLVIGISLVVAGPVHLDLSAWDDPSKFFFPTP
jgi:hypothetical protein